LLGLRRGAPDIEMRVGIATGEVLIGTVGSPTARSFTVIGDAVNAASRLTGVNKVYGTHLLITGDTYRLARGEIEAREIDEVIVAGKSEPVVLYEVLAPAGGLSAADTERCDHYAKALSAYRARDFEGAERGFAECMRLQPDDGPARVLRERAARLHADPPPETWDSVFCLTAK
jgi:adenylate cyclase